MSETGATCRWKGFIQHALEAAHLSGDYPGSLAFAQPASEALIADAESALGVVFPPELESLLAETNGITELAEIADEEIVTGHFIWAVERIKRENLDFRTSSLYKETYMPFDSLLFFADSGCGDNFGFAVLNGEVRKPHVYVWNHEDDSRIYPHPK